MELTKEPEQSSPDETDLKDKEKEIRRLRKELKNVRLEIEILKKAEEYFLKLQNKT
jgi:hypothetical protein